MVITTRLPEESTHESEILSAFEINQMDFAMVDGGLGMSAL